MNKFVWVSLSLLSGLLLFLVSPPLPFWWVSLFALVPLFIAISEGAPRRGIICGLITATFCTFLGEFWVINSITIFGGVPWILALFATLIMSLFGALNFVVFAWLVRVIQRQVKLPVFFLFPSLFLATEWIVPKLFPWFVGSWTHGWRAGRQIADITGIHGPNLIVICCNVTLFLWFLSWWKKRRMPLIETGITIALILVAQFYGSWRIDNLTEKLPQARQMKISVAQTNIGSLQKERAQRGHQGALSFSHRRNEELVLRAGKENPDLIVLPETAVHGIFTQSKIVQYRMFSLARDANAAIFFGGYHSERRDGREVDFNSAFLITPEDQLAGQYSKIKLLLFGEYLPFPDAAIWPNSVKEAVGQFARGKEINLFSYKGEQLAPLICFEGILPQLVRKFVKAGATLFVNISNDSWFGDSLAPHQHFTLDTWRTIEHRKPLVRATNTGISGFINIFGDITDTIPINKIDIRTKSVEIIDEETFYTRHGDWLVWIALLFSMLILLFTFARIIFRKKRV
ncbi:apolipoprotein N-acyltransferase [Bdellovibrionota bacterium]